MTSRTTHTIVTFSGPFRLTGIEGELSAGQYAVDTDEDLVEGVSWQAYQRTGTFLHVPAIGIAALQSQVFAIDPVELETALANDKANAGRRQFDQRLGESHRVTETEAERFTRNDTSGAARRAGQTKRDNEII